MIDHRERGTVPLLLLAAIMLALLPQMSFAGPGGGGGGSCTGGIGFCSGGQTTCGTVCGNPGEKNCYTSYGCVYYQFNTDPYPGLVSDCGEPSSSCAGGCDMLCGNNPSCCGTPSYLKTSTQPIDCGCISDTGNCASFGCLPGPQPTCTPSGGVCDLTSDCCSPLICTGKSGPHSGDGTCSTCIQVGDEYAACTSNSQCCGSPTSAICDLTIGSPTYQQCINPPVLPNRAPNPLSVAPELNVSVLNSTQGVSCSNCGSIPIPTDPDNPGAGQTVHLEFLWYKNTTAIGGWGTSAADFNCAANSCVSGDLITLRARACDDGSPVNCSSEAISSPAQVQDFAAVGSVCNSDKFNNVVFLSGIAAIGMGCIIALAYMLGEFLQNPKLLTWAKTEAGQVVLSAAIVVILLWALSTMCTVRVKEVSALAGINELPKIYTGAAENLPLFSGALLYLENLAGAGLSNLAALRYNLAGYELRTSYSKYICDSVCLFSLSSVNEATYGGETMHLAITNNLLGVGTASYLSVLFQYFTLIYIANGLFVQFLPLAIILRSVPFMRHFGGALIAIFVALYILYPAMLVADAYVAPAFTKYTGTITAYDRGYGCRGLQDVFSTIGGGVSCISTTASCGFLGLGTCTLKEDNIQDMVSLWEAQDSLEDIKPGGLAQSVRLNVLIFLAAIFLPAINFIVIAALARDISRFLGEEADISRLGQMV
ncbi:MAG: hypothetical protein QW568_01755 [Candidatus Anstonellaceae archaeon]